MNRKLTIRRRLATIILTLGIGLGGAAATAAPADAATNWRSDTAGVNGI